MPKEAPDRCRPLKLLLISWQMPASAEAVAGISCSTAAFSAAQLERHSTLTCCDQCLHPNRLQQLSAAATTSPSHLPTTTILPACHAVMSQQSDQPMSAPLAAVTLTQRHVPAVLPWSQASFNPAPLLQHASLSRLNPYATGLSPAVPLYGYVSSPAVALASYSQAAASGLGRVQRSWAPSTLAARERVQHEFTRWINSLPPVFDKSWMNAEPLDIITFCESVWLKHHGGTELPNSNVKAVAPSSLSGELQSELVLTTARCIPMLQQCHRAWRRRNYLPPQHQFPADWTRSRLGRPRQGPSHTQQPCQVRRQPASHTQGLSQRGKQHARQRQRLILQPAARQA